MGMSPGRPWGSLAGIWADAVYFPPHAGASSPASRILWCVWDVWVLLPGRPSGRLTAPLLRFLSGMGNIQKGDAPAESSWEGLGVMETRGADGLLKMLGVMG